MKQKQVKARFSGMTNTQKNDIIFHNKGERNEKNIIYSGSFNLRFIVYHM
jgi:hypothetical protein